MAKKLAIFCDGTWNHLRLSRLTNVARLAKSVAPTDSVGVPQIVFYDEGVGVASNISTLIDKTVEWIGGALGRGLDRKVEIAYRFIALNYESDDEIYVFGFSRGAFTARSLCGLIRKCGILRRDCLERVPEALDLYRSPVHPRDASVISFRQAYSHPRTTGDEDDWVSTSGQAPRGHSDANARAYLFQYRSTLSYRMMYLGVWDTVGALGVPNALPLLRFLNKKYRFHDTNASTLISSIRHAVAIEERRRDFDVTPISNVLELNQRWATAKGWDVSDPANPKFVPYHLRPYQQLWFPGNHGAVGGGHPATGLSNAALYWIAEGAHDAGLVFWNDSLSELWRAAQEVNPMAEWRLKDDGSEQKPNYRSLMERIGGSINRSGPGRPDEVSLPAKIRWSCDDTWRPKPLGVLRGTDCSNVSLPAAPANFPARAPGFPPFWNYAVPPARSVQPTAATDHKVSPLANPEPIPRGLDLFKARVELQRKTAPPTALPEGNPTAPAEWSSDNGSGTGGRDRPRSNE